MPNFVFRKAVSFGLLVFGLCVASFAQSDGDFKANPDAGAGNVLVHSKFGGQIFGFDIDQNGTTGVLTEAQTLGSGNVLAAVETFDQATGKILKVVAKTQSQDDFVTFGIVGNSVGLVMREHVVSFLDVRRTYQVISPLSTNQWTGSWTPPLQKNELLEQVSRNQGVANSAVLGFLNGGDFHQFVFGTNVAANTFGRKVSLTDPTFTSSPHLAFDSKRNVAVVAASDGAVGGPPPKIAQINLTTGSVRTFIGIPGPPPFHQGFINGLAVDSADGIAVTTTEIDFSVQFYDLAKGTGFSQILPGATSQLQSGADVEFDPVNKVFLVAQPVSSTSFSGSSIHVYDTKGNLVESVNGLNFSNTFNVIPAHIGFNPTTRSGFIDGPDEGVTELQSFTY
jgi:hypothetical protein